jgi:ribose 5-phosphate isomerase A
LVTDLVTRLGGESKLRMGLRKDGPVVTDNDQFLLDARFQHGNDMRVVDRVLQQTPGVVETGLFFDLATTVLVGIADQLHV